MNPLTSYQFAQQVHEFLIKAVEIKNEVIEDLKKEASTLSKSQMSKVEATLIAHNLAKTGVANLEGKLKETYKDPFYTDLTVLFMGANKGDFFAPDAINGDLRSILGYPQEKFTPPANTND